MTFSYEEVDRAERERRREDIRVELDALTRAKLDIASAVRDLACLLEEPDATPGELLTAADQLSDAAARVRASVAEENLARSELVFLERRREREDPPCPL